MILKHTVLYILLILSLNLYAQIGGNSTYEFLNLPNSARIASLSGSIIAIKDNDLSNSFINPSLLNDSMANSIAVNYVNYYADVKMGYVSYARKYKENSNIAVGIHYINYGDFTEADETGKVTGSFKAAEYALNVMWSKPIDSMFTIGINVKPILSNLEKYTSVGIVADAGITYNNPKKLLSAAFVIKNMGTQLKPYYKGCYEPVPFEIQLGVSKKLAHAPFRFSILAHHLETPDLTYNNPNDVNNQTDPLTGETQPKEYNLGEKIMRHIVIGTEILLTKNLYFNLGYNYQRRQEMKVEAKTGWTGLSWGLGMKISKFRFSYGRATYHIAGPSNYFSISTNISDFRKVQ